jgi:hypothetical protein
MAAGVALRPSRMWELWLSATTLPTSTVASQETTSTTRPIGTTTTREPAPRISAYFVGNSLTHQTLGEESRGFRAWYVLATQSGHVVGPFGWHIRCGSSLIGTYQNPADICIDPDPEIGDVQTALPGVG